MKKTALIINLLCVIISFSQNEIKVDLSNPNATIYTHLYFLQSDSYNPKKAAKTIFGFKGKEAIEKAIKIKKILDGKGLKVDMTEVPNNPQYSDSTTVKNRNKYDYAYLLRGNLYTYLRASSSPFKS